MGIAATVGSILVPALELIVPILKYALMPIETMLSGVRNIIGYFDGGKERLTFWEGALGSIALILGSIYTITKLSAGWEFIKNKYLIAKNALLGTGLGIERSSWLMTKLSAGWELIKNGYIIARNALLGTEIGLIGKKALAEKAASAAGGVGRGAKSAVGGVGRGAATAAGGVGRGAASAAGGGGMGSMMKGIKATDLIKGAAAILILSASLFVAAKAFQQFGDVTWPAVAMGLVGLAGMAAIAYVLGKAQGEMIKGAIAVAILGVALIPFAFAMSLIAGLDIGSVIAAAAGLVIFSAAVFGLGLLMSSGVGAFIFGAGLLALAGLGVAMGVLGAGLLIAGAGFQVIGSSMGSIIETISNVGTVIGGLFQYIAPIAMLSLALVGLAAALTMVGIAGMASLPGLIAVAAVGTVAVGVGSLLGFGKGDKKEDGDSTMQSRDSSLLDEIKGLRQDLALMMESSDTPLLTEMKGLRQDLNSGKVSVYMDGKKVTSSVTRVMDRIGTNFYGAT
jgi:hypothetical protein